MILASIIDFISKFASPLATIVALVITIIYDYFEPNRPATPCLLVMDTTISCSSIGVPRSDHVRARVSYCSIYICPSNHVILSSININTVYPAHSTTHFQQDSPLLIL
ncbi:hypothetical protein L873DRAFT_351324 [Choiromyces venosus 120613-1]|uniref:Uncharacterized protein n=1 Tax=Choiromyces venosus 120613-1 TaxID=1336337 RepID=A0A3N4IYM0_9PEZI|nr:hypothetical protein L873DRAFT_351324 [Choiromyces venosus 120613-1]